MTCEPRWRGGSLPTAADLAFHRRLVAEIRESLRSRRLTLAERLQALIDLEHHQQHQTDLTRAIYTGQPVVGEESQDGRLLNGLHKSGAYGLRQATLLALCIRPSTLSELPAGSGQDLVAVLGRGSIAEEPVKVKLTTRSREARS